MSWQEAGVWLLTGSGVLAAALGAGLAHSARAGAAMLLDLWTAAALVGLAGAPDARALAFPAALCTLRAVRGSATRRRLAVARLQGGRA